MSSLENGLKLLALLRSAQGTLRVSEAARTLSLPKSTISRLTKHLTEAGFLEREGNGRSFRAGPELFRLGSFYRARLPVEARIDEALSGLVHRYPATAYVGVLRAMDLVVLRRHEGVHPVRYIQEPGATIPAYATAVGKALLARRPVDELVAGLPEHLRSDTRDVDMSRDTLLAELEIARARLCRARRSHSRHRRDRRRGRARAWPRDRLCHLLRARDGGLRQSGDRADAVRIRARDRQALRRSAVEPLARGVRAHAVEQVI